MRSSLFSSSILLALTSTLASAAPLSSTERTRDCIDGACGPRLLHLTKTPTHHPTATKSHEVVQIEIEVTERVRDFDNSFFIPTKETTPSQALVAHRPLTTTYLESLSRARQSIEEKVAKYLSHHKAELASRPRHRVHGKKPCSKKEWLVYLPGNVYVTTHHYISRKPDVAIVGIVLVFLSFIVLAECADRAIQCFRQQRAQNMGRGEIYLEEKDGEVRIIGEGISVVAWEDEKDAVIREVDIEV
jgi:hypothetical protein